MRPFVPRLPVLPVEALQRLVAAVLAVREPLPAGMWLQTAPYGRVASARGPAPPSTGQQPAAPVPRAELPLPGPATDSMLLVERAQAGDVEAFGELYDRYVAMVYRYIAYRVSGPELAEDLTSETFLRALRRITSFSWLGRDVGAWFVTIARNLVADHYKSSRYRLELTVDDVSTSGRVPVADGPEQQVLAGLTSAAVLDAVRRLGSDQQECVALRFLQGLSVSETAAVMGRGEGAVKALQHRAVRNLAKLLPDARG